tara:strand:+ start:4522 stop:6060 length:1539 start_codon:yes stop_codon:yes gene_type:complete
MTIEKKYSISNRFLASLSFNILKSGVSFLTVILLARWLGPQDYGTMVFLLASFVAFQQLLDMASTSAFFTFLSKRHRSKKFITFYWRWIGIQFSVSFLFISILLPDSIIEIVWQGEPRGLILLAFVATFMQQTVWSIISQMAEAKRESIKIQRANAFFAIVYFSIILGLSLFDKLFLPFIFIVLIIEWALASILASKIYSNHEHESQCDFESQSPDTASSVFKEFWVYCWPFIPFVFLSFIQHISSVWMLQEWGGSKQQAYYGIGLQFATVALLITSSILRIFWKEIAEAQHLGDIKKVEILYFKASRGLFFVGAIFAGAISPWSSEIISLFLGKEYLGGIIPLMLMLIYPAHQCLGQLGSAILLATENTKAQVIIGIIFSTIGTLVVFIMLSPFFGLELAAIGLSIKMISVQFAQVNVKNFVISRIFGWKFDWAPQIIGLGLCLSIGWICKYLFINIIESNVIIMFLSSSFLYISLISIIIFYYPLITGFRISEIKSEFWNIIDLLKLLRN